MYIPRPAKLLFTVDDAWNRFLARFGDRVTPWTQLCIERMLACGTTAMGVRRYCCSSPDCSHSRFFCQSCKSKACSACGFKATEQWVTQQSHILPDCDWQHITFYMNASRLQDIRYSDIGGRLQLYIRPYYSRSCGPL